MSCACDGAMDEGCEQCDPERHPPRRAEIEQVLLAASRLGGVKHDAGKLRYDLVPDGAEAAVVAVLTYGAKKYAPENWRKVEEPKARYYAAARRHMAAWRAGEAFDPESGLHHLAHAACCLLFLLDVEVQR
jgi:hypothetical protein